MFWQIQFILTFCQVYIYIYSIRVLVIFINVIYIFTIRHLVIQGVWQLELVGCNEITEAGLWACLTPRIVSLTLSDCINVADDAVSAVAQMLPALNEFTLQAYHVTDAALGLFSSRQSNSLSALRLQSCWELTNHGIVNIGESERFIITRRRILL